MELNQTYKFYSISQCKCDMETYKINPQKTTNHITVSLKAGGALEPLQPTTGASTDSSIGQLSLHFSRESCQGSGIFMEQRREDAFQRILKVRQPLLQEADKHGIPLQIYQHRSTLCSMLQQAWISILTVFCQF